MLPETGQAIPLVLVAVLVGVFLLLRLGTSRSGGADDRRSRRRR